MKRGWVWTWRVLGVLLVLLLAAGGYGYWQMRSMGFFREPVYETERPALDGVGRPAVLVFSKTNAFIHAEAIPVARALLGEIGARRGWSVFATEGGGVFNTEDLARFDVVVFNNVTGNVLDETQRAAFRAWLEGGGGFVGLHAAGDNSHADWPWYLDTVIRARFIGHPMNPQFQSARLLVEHERDPLLAGLPRPWVRSDEWYSFERSPRAPDLRVLLALDESSYQPQAFGRSLAMGEDHPIAWKHCVGAGRVLYSGLGHTAESYAEPVYRDFLERALAWAGAIDPALVAPEGALACETR